jgi:hypothetical protein
MRWGSIIHTWDPPGSFLSFGGTVGVLGSQVPNEFLNLFPNNCSRYPITFALILYSCKLYEPAERRRLMQTCFILGLSKDWLILLIIFYDGPIKDAHHKRKKIESWASPPWATTD